MTQACDLCCDRCGGTDFHHFQGRDRRRQRRWQNRCDACGRVSDYVPTPSEIESQCQTLRAGQGHVGLDDEQEKRWRRSLPQEEHAEDDDWAAAGRE
jgi:hypothetical protein